LFGDGFALGAGSRGGNDLLDGGWGDDVLFGDASERHPRALGGSDVFRFAPGADDDVIADKAPAEPQDLIDLSGWSGISSCADLAGHLQDNLLSLNDVRGASASADMLLVVFNGGVGFLDAEDFLFA
jgi:Ca2+-binding RTX toxin-like protein